MLSSEGHRIFSTDLAREISPRVGLREPYLAEALYHLRRNRWIVPLRRGLYAISVPGALPIHEFEIAMALVDPAAISHWSAMHHHGLTEQNPRKVFVSTTQASVPRLAARATNLSAGHPITNATYQFVHVKPEHFFGVEQVWIGEARVTITDVERTLLDGLSAPRYCGDFAEVLHAFEIPTAQLNLDKIIGYALRLGGTIVKRLGWVLEKQGIGLERLFPLQRASISGYRKLDPTGPRKGPYNSRWMIQENLPGKLRA